MTNNKQIGNSENTGGEKRDGERTHDFLLGAQHTQLAKADVKGGTLERSIRLSDHNDIDPSGESGWVKAAVKLLHRHKHRLRQLAHNIHGLGLETRKTRSGNSEAKEYDNKTIKSVFKANKSH